MQKSFLFFALAFAAAAVSAGETQDLSGGGWTCEKDGVKKSVRVPGTTEEFFTDLSGYDAPRVDGRQHSTYIVKEWLKCKGESVWRREFEAKPAKAGDRRVLRFESTRYIADVYVNGKFVHRDTAPDMPYEVDVTDAVKPGRNLLEVRITNPHGGDYDWRDYMTCTWQDKVIPGGRAMGGVTGRVVFETRDAVSVDDLYVQNTPAMRSVNVFVSVTNAASAALKRRFRLEVAPKGVVVEKEMTFKPGLTVVEEKVDAPGAKLWDVEHPNLYRAAAKVGGESASREFGYRWIAPDGIGTSNAVLRLNGKRIVIRTAIGWGWYLGHGIVPSDEDAKREVAAAKALGQNAVSFHRHNGQENVLREADRQGLLVYAEPGAFQGGRHSDLGRRIAYERVRRWVKAYRSHPSLFHWNLINEIGDTWDDATVGFFSGGVRLAHSLDPSRTVTLTSAWAKEGNDVRHLPKMHMRPFDETLYETGWRDFHRAGGPVLSYHAGFYTGPTRHYSYSTDREEILYWGEEGAFSAPPRLQLIVDELDRRGEDGTDGRVFRVWADKVNRFLDAKNLRGMFPTLDSFCVELGRQSLRHQGRKIELMRMSDVSDGYAVNGWESMLVENNSGIVDTMRNPKSDPSVMAKYNAPLKLAVNSAQPRVERGKAIKADVSIINEVDLKGRRNLVVELWRKGGAKALAAQTRTVSVTGGDRYGELLAEGVAFDVPFAGEGEVRARLEGVEKAVGEFPFTSFDNSVPAFPAGWRIAVAEGDGKVASWMKRRGVPFVAYSDADAARSDVIVVARPPSVLPAVVESKSLESQSGKPGVAEVRWYDGKELKCVETRDSAAVDFPAGHPPVKELSRISGYSAEIVGSYVARWSGEYRFTVEMPGRRNGDESRFFWDGRDVRFEGGTAKIVTALKKGDVVPFVVSATQKFATGLKLIAQTPEPVADFIPEKLLARAAKDGSRVVVLSSVEQWAPLAAKATGVEFGGMFELGTDWLGGMYFVKPDPLFAGFPAGSVGEAFEDVAGGRHRSAMWLDGEELVMGAWQCENCKLGTAVGRIRSGKGEIVLSTLDVVPKLGSFGADRIMLNAVSPAKKERGL